MPAVEYWSVRLIEEDAVGLAVRQGVAQPPLNRARCGALLTIGVDGGVGYAATADLSAAGVDTVIARAVEWARATAPLGLIRPEHLPRISSQGRYATPVALPWESTSLADKWSLLQDASKALKIHERIVDWQARLEYKRVAVLLLSGDGAHLEQHFSFISPGLSAVANHGAQTQRRTGGGLDMPRQGGLEQAAELGFPRDAQRIAEEALILLDAPECPVGVMDLMLTPSQMMLQIHESIGHPLELDRILGDERNYAGTSFVTLDMFGSYRYGSELLNVTFDPRLQHQVASFAYDDEGSGAERVYLIRDGVLERPLGGATSQARAGMTGVAAARACQWNRPAIDRMANLNLEPGASALSEMIAAVERGVLMDNNRSWSIDDSRNKFQFGCEYARLIEDGELKHVVRNPAYRGVSANFWRNLAMVGDTDTFQVLGTPTCGKGEPNQAIHVGHASPTCLFRDVQVFGGANAR